MLVDAEIRLLPGRARRARFPAPPVTIRRQRAHGHGCPISVLARIDARSFFGGRKKLAYDLARKAIEEKVARRVWESTISRMPLAALSRSIPKGRATFSSIAFLAKS